LEVERVFAPGTEPIRTCIGCRRVAPQSALIRMVGINHAGQVRIQVDEKRRLPGRGAWLHPDQNCINHAIQRRAFNRALRKSSPIDTAGLVEWWSIAQLEYFGKSDEKAGRKADGSPMSTQR